jgi:hypothetical protein
MAVPNLRYVPSRYFDLNSYPDLLLQIPFQVAVEYIRASMPADLWLARGPRHSIHIMEGLVLPEWVKAQISVGLKYLLHTRMDLFLIPKAWSEFSNTCRWYVEFSGKKNNEIYD